MTQPGATRTTVVLVGRPNAGKSSLYNRLTGGDAHVGNFPGITVDVLTADVSAPDGTPLTLVDLPGLYSFEAATDPGSDEGVARTFVDRLARSGTPWLIAQVADATTLALGLRLTAEVLAQRHPAVLLVTQTDVLASDDRVLDPAVLERALGIPVLAVSARRAATRDAVLARLATFARTGVPPPGARSFDPDALARNAIRDGRSARGLSRTERADRVLLHPVAGPVIFLAIMSALFAAVFLVADPVSTAMDALVQFCGARVVAVTGPGLVGSFVSDGLLGGAGTVLAFLPQIVVLTIAMELLEASGYLARAAFLVDRLLRSAGLGGRAFVPLLTAHACAVPAIAATRILRDPRERLTAILVLPLMTCSARIPTYGLLIAAFFGHRSAWVQSLIFLALYLGGAIAGLVASAVFRRTVTRGRGLPLVMEMPAYRSPEARTVARVAWRAGTRFVREVGTTILVVSAVLWALLTVPRPGAPVSTLAAGAPVAEVQRVRIERSVAAGVGHALAPLTRPCGFDWRIDVGLIASFGARELMVGTMGVIFGIEDADEHGAPLAQRIRTARTPSGGFLYDTRTALALMAFFVLACQCMSTVAAIRRETRTWRWPLFVLGYTYVCAYGAAVVTYQVSGWLGAASRW